MSADKLRERLVLAVLDALEQGDPVLVIGVAANELRIGWPGPDDADDDADTDQAVGLDKSSHS